MKKKLSLLLLLFTFITLATGCGATKAPATSEPVNIGVVYPLSGALAALGTESFRGAELATIKINAQGGLWGKQIKLVKGDAPDANAAQAEAERLINKDNVKFMMGSYSSSIALAASDVAARNNVPFMELGGIGDAVTERGYKYVFRMCPKASDFAELAVKFVNEVAIPQLKMDPKTLKVAVVHEDSLYGTTIASYSAKFAKTSGFEVGKVIPYNAKAVDLSSVIMDLKNYNPDVVIATSYITDAILFWRQSKELNFSPKIFIGTGGGHGMAELQQALGSDVEGLLDVEFPLYEINKQKTPGMDEFIELYKKTYGEPPHSSHSLANYMGALATYDILKKSGSFDPETVRKAVLSADVAAGTTASGWGVKFDPNSGQNNLAKPVMIQWTKDKAITVWPTDYAVSAPVVPMPTFKERAAKK